MDLSLRGITAAMITRTCSTRLTLAPNTARALGEIVKYWPESHVLTNKARAPRGLSACVLAARCYLHQWLAATSQLGYYGYNIGYGNAECSNGTAARTAHRLQQQLGASYMQANALTAVAAGVHRGRRRGMITPVGIPPLADQCASNTLNPRKPHI